MNVFAIPPLISFILVLSIGLFVFLNNIRSKTHITFGLLCFSASWWLLGFSLMYLSADNLNALRWARFGFLGIIFIPVFAYHFIVEFSNSSLARKIVFSIYLLTIPSLIFSHTNYIYSGIAKHFYGFYPIAGSFYFLFLLEFFLLFSYGILLLFFSLLRYKKSRELLKFQQTRYVLIAFAFGATGIVDYIAKYPLPLYPFGYLSAIMLISTIAYAIVTTRLLDIEVVIKRGFVYSILSASLMAIYSLGIFLATQLFQRVGISPWILAVLGSIIIAAGFLPLYDFLTDITDRFFFRKKYEYQKTLTDLSRALAHPTTLDELTERTARLVCGIMKISGVSILTSDEKYGRFVVRAAEGDAKEIKGMTISDNYGIILELMNIDRMIIFDEIKYMLGSQSIDERERKRLEQIRDEMVRLKASACVPCMLRAKKSKKLIAVLTLGDKLSGDPYTGEDIDLFSTLSNQAATAISYAMFMEEAVQKEKLASLGTIVTGVAHEIRNPLSYIKSSTQLLPEKLGNTEWINKYILELLPKEIMRLEGIVDSLLSFGKPKEPKFEIQDINKLLEGIKVLATMQIKAQDKSIIFSMDLAPLPQVYVDPSKITQVIMGLITNAIEAIPKSGEIKISSKTEGRNVLISVSDTGAGISKDNLSKIFDPFFTTKEKGTGLGLSIMYKIVEQHKGRLEVESEVGRGTTFTIILPSAA